MFITKIGRKFFRLCQLLEKPILLQNKLRGNKVDLDLYYKLNTQWFKSLNINTVIDIGAFIGQFSSLIHVLLPECRIYAFEPLPECYDKLIRRMACASHFKAYNFALGNEGCKVKFYPNEYKAASSILQMSEVATKNFTFLYQKDPFEVKVAILDDIVRDLELIDSTLIKIDVQGYEDKVIKGAEKILKRTKVVIVETSFGTIYTGQPLFKDIFNLLTSMGFNYNGSLGEIKSHVDGRILQQDSLFINEICDD